MRFRRLTALLGALTTLASDASPKVQPAASSALVVVAREGDDAFACAPGYVTFFERGALRFRPAGSEPSPERELRLVVESARRGDALRLLSATAALPQVEGRTVRYARPGFTEVYEAGAQGLEQSFVFHEPFGDAGELVVRLALDTALEPVSIAPDGIVLALDGAPAVRIGAVFGTDAAGREAQGELRLEGDRLELCLPAAFVDGARYPLVLDPLITPFQQVPATHSIDAQPDVAWDAQSLRYCVVWNRLYSGLTAHLFHVFEADGTPVAPIGVLGWSGGAPVRPAVCAVERSHAFLAAHYEPHARRIQVSSIRASDLAMQKVRLPVTHCYGLDIGGNANSSALEAWLVWNDGGGVLAQQWQAPAGGSDLEPWGEPFELVGSGSAGLPRISQTGGTDRIWCVVWARTILGLQRIEARSLAWTGPGPSQTIAEGSQLREPSLCGFGGRFLVAWRDATADEIAGAEVKVSSSGSIEVEHEAVLDSGEDGLVLKPEVAHVQDLPDEVYVVSWRVFGGSTGDTIRYRGFERGGLAPRGPKQALTSGVRSSRIASLRVQREAMDIEPRRWFTFAVELDPGLFHAVAVP